MAVGGNKVHLTCKAVERRLIIGAHALHPSCWAVINCGGITQP